MTGVATGGGRDFEEFEAIHRFPKRSQEKGKPGDRKKENQDTGNRLRQVCNEEPGEKEKTGKGKQETIWGNPQVCKEDREKERQITDEKSL